jgi:hypothetical protein
VGAGSSGSLSPKKEAPDRVGSLFSRTDERVYDTLSAIMASVNSTSVSTNTRPRIMAVRIGPDAPG